MWERTVKSIHQWLKHNKVMKNTQLFSNIAFCFFVSITSSLMTLKKKKKNTSRYSAFFGIFIKSLMITKAAKAFTKYTQIWNAVLVVWLYDSIQTNMHEPVSSVSGILWDLFEFTLISWLHAGTGVKSTLSSHAPRQRNMTPVKKSWSHAFCTDYRLLRSKTSSMKTHS